MRDLTTTICFDIILTKNNKRGKVVLNVLFTAISAVLPIVLTIMLGYFLKRINLLKQGFLTGANTFVFKVCLPCLLFINIYNEMDSFANVNWTVVIYAVIVVLVLFGIGLLVCVLTTKDNKRRGVILQCSFRSNYAIIGLTLIGNLGGDVALGSIVSAFSIPLFNILAVIALSIFVKDEQKVEGENGEVAPKKKNAILGVLLNIVKNPLIIGVCVGLIFVAIREIMVAACGVPAAELPFRFDKQLSFLYGVVKNVSVIATPLALIVLGGQFEFSAVKGMAKEITVGTLCRIVLAPLIGIGVAILLDNYTAIEFGASAYPTLIALFGTPVAVASAIMAGGMNNDQQLATQLVVWTSIGSIFTLIAIVAILLGTGYIII